MALPGQYMYSNGFYYNPLPQVYPNPAYYYQPPYVVPPGYPQGYPVSPRRPAANLGGRRARDRSPGGPREVMLHEWLQTGRNTNIIWGVDSSPATAQHYPTDGWKRLRPLPEDIINLPATEPAISKMRLVSEDFPWEVIINIPDVITVGHILSALYKCFQQPLAMEEWQEFDGSQRKKIHRARCARLAKLPPKFVIPHAASEPIRADTLGERVTFGGIAAVGPPEKPKHWMVTLKADPDKGRR